MPRVEIAIELDTITCYMATCAITFAVPMNWRDQKLRDHTDFYCPNGHGQMFSGKSKEEKLQEELNRVRKIAEAERRLAARLEENNVKLKHQVRAQKGVATRLRNKAIAGICAFCACEFPNVAEHVRAEHPGESISEDPE